MKKVFYLAVAMLLVFSGVTFAQNGKAQKTPEQKVIMQIAKIEASVGAITEKERQALKEFFTKQQEIKQQEKDASKTKCEERKAECDKELKKILGEERFKKLEQVQPVKCDVKKEQKCEKKSSQKCAEKCTKK